MAERKSILETARFLDSYSEINIPRAKAREITQRFLQCCYDDLGKAPQYLDGEDLNQILCLRLPTYFAKRDPLAPMVPDVLEAFFQYLSEHELVPHSFELQQALHTAAPDFAAAVQRGAATASHPAPKTIVSKGSKVGRNDPCPCGSGKKFKKCCARLGGDS